MRALISNGMLRGQRHKLWCLGPMFRHEAPQAGRYRQFWQVDVEAVGSPGPDVDAELIAMSARLWRHLGIEGLTLHLNSLGTPDSRRVYRAQLVEYLEAHASQLDDDSRRRLVGNPLRVLDSKNPDMQELIRGAPRLTEYLDAESRAHFETLCGMLGAIGVPYEINPRLVRGLDYYNRTVFEWVTAASGACSRPGRMPIESNQRAVPGSRPPRKIFAYPCAAMVRPTASRMTRSPTSTLVVTRSPPSFLTMYK